MAPVFTNNATSTLAGAITNTALSLSIQSADAAQFPAPSDGNWFPLTVIDLSGNMEIMRCTARAGTVLTVERGKEGTTARAFAAGSRIDVRITAAVIAEIIAGRSVPEGTALIRLPGTGPGPMVDGTMEEFRSALGAFNTKATFAEARPPLVLVTATIEGHTVVGKGRARYKRVSSEPSHPGKVQTADGWWWEIAEEVLNFYQFGAWGNGAANDRQAVVDCIECASELGGAGNGRKIEVSHGTFGINATVTIPDNNSGVSQLKFEGVGRYAAQFVALAGFTGSTLFDIQGVTDFHHIGFIGAGRSIHCFVNDATGADIPSRITNCQFVLFDGAVLYNTDGHYEFCHNRVGSCKHAIINYDWGTGSRVLFNDMLADDTCVVLTNNGRSNEGMYFIGNLIGSVAGHGLQLNKGLLIYFIANQFTPILAQADGKQGVLITGGVGPVYFEMNWIEGLRADSPCAELDFDKNTFPNGLSLVLNSPETGGIYSCRIKNTNFTGSGTAARLALTNCANILVEDNRSTGPFYENGGSGIMLFKDNEMSGEGYISPASICINNKGGSGYTNLVEYTTSGIDVSGVVDATGFKVGGQQVVGARGTAVADATGGTTVDAEARAAINALLARVRAHGLIELS